MLRYIPGFSSRRRDALKSAKRSSPGTDDETNRVVSMDYALHVFKGEKFELEILTSDILRVSFGTDLEGELPFLCVSVYAKSSVERFDIELFPDFSAK